MCLSRGCDVFGAGLEFEICSLLASSSKSTRVFATVNAVNVEEADERPDSIMLLLANPLAV